MAATMAWIANAVLAVTVFLIFPSWITGPLALWPLATLRVSDHVYRLGALLILPLLGTVTAMAARGFGRLHLHLGPIVALAPIVAYGTLVLIRIPSVHTSHKAVTIALSVAVLWGSYVWARHIMPLKAMVAGWAISLIVQGMIGIFQFARQGSVGLWVLGERWLHADGAGLSVIVVEGRRWLRAYGLMPHPNILGGYLAMWALVCISAALVEQPRGRHLERWALWGAVAIGSVGIFFTFSRSAWLGYAVGLVYVVTCTPLAERLRRWLRRPRNLILLSLLLLTLICIALVLAGGILASRFLHLGEPLERASLSERAIDIGLAWTLIRARPFLGVGPGNYDAALWASIGNSQGEGFPGFRIVHNAPLLAAAELGIVGALLWLWVLLAPVLLRAMRRPLYSETFMSAGVAAAWLCVFVISMFDHYLYPTVGGRSALHLGLLTAAWAQLITQDKEAHV